MTDAPTATSRRRWLRSAAGALIFVLVILLCLRVGWAAVTRYYLVNWDGLAAVAHAYDVLYKESGAHLALLGFVEPPLPGLIATMLAGLGRALLHPAFVPAAIGALLLALGALAVRRIGGEMGLGEWSLLFAVVLVLDPIVLSYAAGGAPAVLLILLLLGGAYSLSRWGEHQRFRDLLAVSLYLAGALMTRYEVMFVVAAVAAYTAYRSARENGAQGAEGTVIAFLLPIVYVAAAWIGVCWVIEGDPWFFWRNTFSEVPFGPLRYPLTAIGEVLRMLLICSPLLLPAAYHALRDPGLRARAAGPLLMICGSGAAVIILGPLHASLPGDAWTQLTTLVAVSIAAGLVVVMMAAAHLAQRRATHRQRAVVVVLAVAALLANLWLVRAGYGRPDDPAAVLSGKISFADDASDEMLAARYLCADLDAGAEPVIAGWPGFAVALFTRQVDRITVLPTVLSRLEDRQLRPGDIVVLKERTGPGGLARPGYKHKWDDRLPPSLRLEPRWCTQQWIGYEVVEGDGQRARIRPRRP